MRKKLSVTSTVLGATGLPADAGFSAETARGCSPAVDGGRLSTGPSSGLVGAGEGGLSTEALPGSSVIKTLLPPLQATFGLDLVRTVWPWPSHTPQPTPTEVLEPQKG